MNWLQKIIRARQEVQQKQEEDQQSIPKHIPYVYCENFLGTGLTASSHQWFDIVKYGVNNFRDLPPRGYYAGRMGSYEIVCTWHNGLYLTLSIHTTLIEEKKEEANLILDGFIQFLGGEPLCRYQDLKGGTIWEWNTGGRGRFRALEDCKSIVNLKMIKDYGEPTSDTKPFPCG